MPDLNGNEKHVKLQKRLPTDASKPGTIRNGDLMLWDSDTLVVFDHLRRKIVAGHPHGS